MSLERFHGYVKQEHFTRTKTYRVDKAIYLLLKFTDQQFREREICLRNQGKRTKRTSESFKNHKLALALFRSKSTVIDGKNGYFTVKIDQKELESERNKLNTKSSGMPVKLGTKSVCKSIKCKVGTKRAKGKIKGKQSRGAAIVEDKNDSPSNNSADKSKEVACNDRLQGDRSEDEFNNEFNNESFLVSIRKECTQTNCPLKCKFVCSDCLCNLSCTCFDNQILYQFCVHCHLALIYLDQEKDVSMVLDELINSTVSPIDSTDQCCLPELDSFCPPPILPLIRPLKTQVIDSNEICKLLECSFERTLLNVKKHSTLNEFHASQLKRTVYLLESISENPTVSNHFNDLICSPTKQMRMDKQTRNY